MPYPHAVDDHQTANARTLTDEGAGWLMPQSALTPQGLADFVQSLTRAELLQRAERAHALRRTGATEAMVAACEELTA